MGATPRPKPNFDVRDFDSFAFGLLALFERGIISRAELRAELRDWGMLLDDDEVVSGETGDADRHQ